MVSAETVASAGMPRPCRGWPEGHVCPVLVTRGQWCQGCLLRKQEATVLGIPGDVIPVGIILEDFEAPRLKCACGGDPEGPRHVDSLLHLKWSYLQRGRGLPERLSESHTK